MIFGWLASAAIGLLVVAIEQRYLRRSPGRPVVWYSASLSSLGERFAYVIAVAVLWVFGLHSIGYVAIIFPAAAVVATFAMRASHNHRAQAIGTHRR